ncbi:hypothetical protein BS47DRAFT_220147 [Hydnum rufescens UP504]|uniref:RNI-like protein n=1 Tax=Hydnum rufescens UP504 TaxID=1448309 RepID=A0A9P6AN03_9AGAM|nr:hypothetical protein BS47DRAFT_220147 [Hydnum rufescens UP504]
MQSPLKRAHFILPHLSTVYPISSQAAPSSAELTEARREIDDKARELRDKEKEEGAGAWSLGRVEEFYRECCRLRDENVIGGVVGAFRQANLIAPRTLDLTSVKLSFDASAALADVFALEWGLRKLILRDCDLDESSLKPLLHALLIPDSLPYLSLSSNKRLKAPAFRLLGVYVSRSDTLEFLDISQTPLDKRSIEYIVSALQPAPPSESTSHNSPVTSNAQFGESTTPSGISQPGVFAPTSPILSPSSPQFPLRSELSLKGPNALPEKVDLLSLRMDECQLRGGALEALAHAIRTSSIQHLSLRSNRIGQAGAVSLALMIKDYPDSVPAPAPTTSTLSRHSSSSPSTPTSPYFTRSPGAHLPPAPGLSSLPLPGAASQASSVTPATPSARSQLRINPLGSFTPSPRHPGGTGFTSTGSADVSPAPQTTYTPYIPRSKRNMVPPPVSAPLTPMSVPSTPPSTYRDSRNSHPNASDVPTFTSSRTGGITTRHPVSSVVTGGNFTTAVNGSSSRFRRASSDTISPGGVGTLDGHSAALLDKVRSLDTLPRLGALQTLDLRGNDLRAGVSYIAQVLKRNRTLKVLNLADNRVEVGGFVAIAEALVKIQLNSGDLDMSGNPCCGPSLEGVTAIRTAFTINTALKRLSLSSTGLNSDGAIALAEFLPDARRLLHLDLTHNPLDIAGVMALSVGLKVNRCNAMFRRECPAE